MSRPEPSSTDPDPLDLACQADDLCERFEQAWLHAPQPVLASWLPLEGPLRRVALIELARVDLEYRLRAGEPIRAESYFACYPELRADPDKALRLIAIEAQTRGKREPGLRPAEYQERFPDLVSHPENPPRPQAQQRHGWRIW